VDIYVEVPLGSMEFKRSKTDKQSYVTKFDLNIDVKDKNDVVVYNNISKEEITTKQTGQEYLSQNTEIISKNLFLPPGDYKVKVSLYEQSSKNRSEKEKKVTVRDFAASTIALSDVMIVSKMSTTTGKKIITPDVARNVGAIDTFYLFYYVYRNSDEQQIDVSCRIFDAENKEVYSGNQVINTESGITFQNQIFMPVPTEKLAYGKYTVEITAASGSQNVSEKAYFDNQNTDFPLALKDIDVLIEQLQYIAKDEEMTFMRDGNTDVEKQKRFVEFWKKKDPSPNTKRNEAMQDYYKRLAVATKLFSTIYTQGWRTDMGMVFIIFGEPNNIERHPYEMDSKPYEVWDYYSMNKQFVFVDNTGFGDYRLVTPIWDTYKYRN
jgi:GWxTD domain-containing protein